MQALKITSLLREQRDYNCFFQTATKKNKFVASFYIYQIRLRINFEKKRGVLYMSNLCRNRFTLKQTINGLIVVRTATEKKCIGMLFCSALFLDLFCSSSSCHSGAPCKKLVFVFFVLIISQICQRFCFLSQVLVEFVFCSVSVCVRVCVTDGFQRQV